jgi:hypothetical protein
MIAARVKMFGGAANTPNAVNLNRRFTLKIILVLRYLVWFERGA